MFGKLEEGYQNILFKKLEETFNELKGQIIIVDGICMRFLGILKDEDSEHYYILYDGKQILLISFITKLIKLKGCISDEDYDSIIFNFSLNHKDQEGFLEGDLKYIRKYINYYRNRLKNDIINQGGEIIFGLYWTIN